MNARQHSEAMIAFEAQGKNARDWMYRLGCQQAEQEIIKGATAPRELVSISNPRWYRGYMAKWKEGKHE